MEQSRSGKESPGVPRSIVSITEFLQEEDYSRAMLSTPEPCPCPSKAPVAPADDFTNHQDSHLHPPKASSPMESEADYCMERSTARLVSMDEFIKQEQQPNFNTQPKGYAGGIVEPPYGAADASRGSDLSDILEEEEDDVYSDPPGPALPRGYTTGANRPDQWELPDSDEDALEGILKLPSQAQAEAYHHHHHHHNKLLFSIPEVTDEEDNSLEEDYHHGRYRRRSQAPPSRTHLHPDDPHYHSARPQAQHKAHYPGKADSTGYPEEGQLDSRQPRDRWVRRAPQKAYQGGGVGTVALVGGLGDRLRREALLRSQMAVAALTSQSAGHAPGSYMVSKTVRMVKSPVGSATEIDLEYGTDEEEPVTSEPKIGGGDVVLDQMSSEWWVEGAQRDPLALRRGKPALQAIAAAAADWEHCREPSMEAGAGCSGQAELSPRLNRADVRQQLKESMEPARPIGEHEVRIFVALFPYDPVNMSPNPDAAEEELPFREGQIIKIYGDKDSDGFYRGESSGRHGYVPCNMVSEIQVEDEETRETLLRQGFLSTAVNMEKMGARSHAQLPRRLVPPPKPRRSKKASGSEEDQGDVFQTALLSPPAHTSNRPSVESAALWEESLDLASQDPNQPGAAVVNLAATGPHRMKAIFDYDPRESSPNADIEAELTFSAGDIIYVFGDMDDDGFFYGDLNGHKGLVPSNFLQAAPEAAGKVSDPQAPPHAVTQSRRESQVIPGPCVNETTPDSVNPPPLHAGLTGPAQHLHLDPPASAAMIDPSSTDPGEGPRSPNPPHTPAECSPKPDQRDTSLPEKKKRGFFSKGKKLLKKLGSNKKD